MTTIIRPVTLTVFSLLMFLYSSTVFAQSDVPSLNEPLKANEPVAEAPSSPVTAEAPPLSPDITPAPAPAPVIAPPPKIVPPPPPAVAPNPAPAPPVESPPVEGDPTPAVPSTTTAATAADNTPREDTNEEPNGFSGFSISPQVGYSYYPGSEYDYNGIKLQVDKRNSFVAKVHLDLGGDGIAFEIAPLIAFEKIGGDLSSFSEDLGSGVSGSLFALGGQTNIVFRGSWGSFYPHLGIGFHGTYLFGDNIEYGAEIYGRIPLGFTWYFAKHVAMVVEFAFMYGATGIRGKIPDTKTLYADLEKDYGITQDQIENIDWQNSSTDQIQSDLGLTQDQVDSIVQDKVSETIKFGKGYAFELMVGFRFP
ncbi:MAG: hypothetical protein JXR91_15195 [Deltaproteobacteria bacterium]|nr:hypothetical protein [Deltaproteobacteria bacterium]